MMIPAKGYNEYTAVSFKDVRSIDPSVGGERSAGRCNLLIQFVFDLPAVAVARGGAAW
jgi:hypothetical protein